MIEQLNLKARWGSRRESIEECVSRTLKFLQQLSEVDDSFVTRWLKCGRSLKATLSNEVPLTNEALRKVLENGRLREEDGGAIIEDLGFSSGRFWNGLKDDEAAHVSIRCGAYAANVPNSNDVIISFPTGAAAVTSLLVLDKLVRIVEVVVASWDPAWARISTYQMDQQIHRQPFYTGPQIGWITYLSDLHKELHQLPDDWVAKRIPNRGTIIVLKKITCVSSQNAEHIQSIRKLERFLRQHELLSSSVLKEKNTTHGPDQLGGK